jgi:hypothetical protein
MLKPFMRTVLLLLLALTAAREASAQTLTIRVAPGTKVTIIRDPAKPGSDSSSNANRGADYVPPGHTEKMRRERAERDSEWQTRCKPQTYTDKDGVSRYRYAQRGCDVQVLN